MGVMLFHLQNFKFLITISLVCLYYYLYVAFFSILVCMLFCILVYFTYIYIGSSNFQFFAIFIGGLNRLIG